MALHVQPDVSLIFPACNQGDWVRRTIPFAVESLGRLSHEVIVVDDHSLDGCCHGLGLDVTVLHPHTRLGVSGARRFAVEAATGSVLLFSDPHCEYPGGTLEQIAKLASKTGSIIQPRTKFTPDAERTYAGSVLAVSERGLWTKPKRDAAPHPALYNTIYAVRRDVYDKLGGWPLLPGVWSGSEQALSLTAWCLGVPIEIDESCVGVHYQYQDNRRFPFSMPQADWAKNTHYVHAAFFPATYPQYWRPMITKFFGDIERHIEPLRTKGFREVRQFITQNRVRTEEQFFTEVLAMPYPVKDNRKFEADQKRRATPKLHPEATPRIDKAIQWLIRTIPGCLKGRRMLDVGTRDGYAVGRYNTLGAREVAGIEVVKETAKFANENTGGVVRHADMRSIPDPDNSWDIVTCMHALEHVPDPKVGLHEMVRVLKPGGWLFVVVPLEETPSKKWAHNCCFASVDDVLALATSHSELVAGTAQTSVVQYSASGNNECRLLIMKRHNGQAVRRRRQAKEVEHKAEASEARFPNSRDNPDCKDASLWTAINGSTAETEVSELVEAFVRALQPDLVVETGACDGITSRRIGKALLRNQHGKLVTFETDGDKVQAATAACRRLPVQIVPSPVWEWEPPSGEVVDFVFLDANQRHRVKEFKHLRKWMNNKTVVAFHDTSPLKRGRRQVETLVSEGLIQPLFLPTPRGICFARVMDA